MEFKELLRIQKSMGAPIKLKTIPSSFDLQEKELNDLTNEIVKTDIKDEASIILSTLQQESDISEIALKAISLLLSKHSSKGPEHIGFSEKEAKRLLEKFKEGDKRNKNQRGRRDGRSRSRNNRNRSRRR
jgi:ATP-dependent RNA helicase DeaD